MRSRTRGARRPRRAPSRAGPGAKERPGRPTTTNRAGPRRPTKKAAWCACAARHSYSGGACRKKFAPSNSVPGTELFCQEAEEAFADLGQLIEPEHGVAQRAHLLRWQRARRQLLELADDLVGRREVLVAAPWRLGRALQLFSVLQVDRHAHRMAVLRAASRDRRILVHLHTPGQLDAV